MGEQLIDGGRYLSLTDMARMLGKNQAALRARLKRGRLDAITRAIPSDNPESKRFLYLIPLSVASRELERIVRAGPTLQTRLSDDAVPNLYQIICDLLTRREEGMTTEELHWQLERFHGISLSETSLDETLELFSEFSREDDRYILNPSFRVDIDAARKAADAMPRRDSAAAIGRGASPAALEDIERRLGVVESKLELVTQLLGNKM